MKRFFKKSYSWLATLLLTVAFAVSGNASAKSVEIAVSASQSITQGDISTYAAYWTGSQVNLYGDLDSEWGYLDVTSFAGAITKVEFYGASEMNTVTCLTGKVSGTSTVGVWEGSEQKVRFHSSSDIYVDKIVVFYEEGGAKECTVDVDHYADNCKPGKHETPFSRYITLYMQENAATTTWTGSDNCPEGVTLTNEAGQQFRVAQFNTWATSEQLGIQFENEISTPGVYTLHIPEGLVAFESGKFNKEINVVWTIVEPDTRPTKEVVFDFTDGTYTNDGTLSYTKDGVVFTLNENRWTAQAQGFRIGTDGWVSFTAPEKATIKSIQLLQESSYGASPDFIPSVGEVSVYDKTLNWTGDDANVTLTDHYGTCYFTKAIVTLAVEESEEPVVPEVDPAEEAYAAWKTLVTTDMKAVKDEWGTAPEADVPGKKPAAVVKAVMGYYNSTSWLFGPMGFGDNWAAAKDYYAGYGTTIEANYAEASTIWQLYLDAELVPVVVEPTYTEPVLSAEDVSAEVAYYIFTDARGGLTVDGDQLKGTKEVGKNVDATDVNQQFAFVNWNDNLYLYSLAAEKFIGKANRGNFTEEPVDPIYFKNASNGTVMLYFDDSFNFNLGGSNQVTIDTWKQKDAGNSFKIMVAEKFDQTALLEKIAGGGEVVDPVEPIDLSKFAGEWYFKGEGAYCNSPENIDGALNPKSEYTVNVEVQNGEIYMTGLVGDVYDYPYAYYGYYDAEANTLRFHTNSYIEDPNYEYYLMDQPLVFNVVKDEDGNISLVNTTGWEFIYEDWYWSQYACGFTSCTMTREKQAPVEPVTEPFELIVKNNNVLCANGAEVEAAEYGIASDFYLGNEGLTAKGNTATLYKDGSAMSFSITMVSNTGISFFGGASQFTEPGTYTLEVPAGTYIDAAGNPSIAFTGTWVLAQKDEPVVDPTTKDKYTIKLSGTDYYFTTTEVKDNNVTTYSLSATPEYFYIEPSGNGYTIQSADTEKWAGYDVISTWDFSNDEKVWQIGSLEGEPTLIYKNGSKGFGVDNQFEGAGVYTDKSNQYWIIEKVVETEPTEWNGNVIYPETAANLDDLLSYTVEFEEATTVEASGYDVLAAVFDANGEPYAIALANGVFDVFGSISFEGSKATVNFMKISDLTAAAQTSAKAAAARIGGFIQPAGKASVVFAGKSFKVDGELVYDILQKDYELGENGVPTGIDTIVTNGNDSIYDLNGRRVNSVRSGLYIKNGVKVLY